MLHLQNIAVLPTILQARRDKLAAEPKDRHAASLADQVFAKTVEVRQAPATKPTESDCRLVAWNAERCYQLEASANLLASLEADVILLTEMDYGMARTGQEHTTARLASSLGMGYVYGVEFLQFSLGTLAETASCVDQSNNLGYHGNAILAQGELKRPALVRLEVSGDWFKRSLEPRLGGRMATLATIEIGGQDVVFASVHLEDRTGPDGRRQQMEVLLQSIEDYAPGAPAVIGGDLNSHSFDLHKLSPDLQQLRQLFSQDPDRLLRPEAHEPLFAAAAGWGYDWGNCNQRGVATDRQSAKPLSLTGNKKMDWFLTRGLTAFEPKVIAATPADIAWPLSDHELISCRLKAS